MASMMPWCDIPVLGGASVLFGFALQHPHTGGLAWTRSSPIVNLSSDERTARTASGTLWVLGRRMSMLTIAHLGLEARTAFAGLFESDGLNIETLEVPELPLDWLRRKKWLTTCKMSRHLGIRPPQPISADVDAFVLHHGPAYIERRRGR